MVDILNIFTLYTVTHSSERSPGLILAPSLIFFFNILKSLCIDSLSMHSPLNTQTTNVRYTVTLVPQTPSPQPFLPIHLLRSTSSQIDRRPGQPWPLSWQWEIKFGYVTHIRFPGARRGVTWRDRCVVYARRRDAWRHWLYRRLLQHPTRPQRWYSCESWLVGFNVQVNNGVKDAALYKSQVFKHLSVKDVIQLVPC